MHAMSRIEQSLTAAIVSADASGCPPRLAEALRYAVFPGGSRLRPRLCLAVASACGDGCPPAANAAAAAVELLHCASLVHDDLPCFDNADTRRGKASLHRAFSESLAVLTGDALIVLSFDTLASGFVEQPAHLAPVVSEVARLVGAPGGIVAGQAWECEPQVSLADYQRAKTGALFAAATVAGAAAAGMESEPWRELGEKLGESYQVVDDIRDVIGRQEELGKPTNQDEINGRPSAVQEMGLQGAIAHLEALVQGAAKAVPPCPGAATLRTLIVMESQRLLSKLGRKAA
ncbi:MAG: polyprenyl synthetase family protein [Pseudomonadota bacterium]